MSNIYSRWRHVGSGSIGRDNYTRRKYANRNRCNHGVGRDVDNRDSWREVPLSEGLQIVVGRFDYSLASIWG
jgi:hypothetical protein